MNHFGETLRKIRENLALSQAELSSGIMTQSNYSKVEQGKIDIPFSKMVAVLDRVGMSVEEFLYIHHDYSNIQRHTLLNLTNLNYNDVSKLKKYKNEMKKIQNPTVREIELLAIYEALILIAEKEDYESARKKVLFIWNRLEKYNEWYLYDIRLINNILYIFPIETAASIVHSALKQLQKYSSLRGVNNLTASIRVNFITLLMKEGKMTKALREIEKLISYCIQKNLLILLGICYIRKGLLLQLLNKGNTQEWFQKGNLLLDSVQANGIKSELEKEILQYTTNKP